MEFYKQLYLGNDVAKRADTIKKKLEEHQFIPFVHVITLPLMKDGLLEIYPAYVLCQPFYKSMDIKVVGIAAGRGEACDMVQQMVQECLALQGDVDLKSYFKFD